MTVISLDTVSIEEFPLQESLSWHDPDVDCTLVLSQPSADPDLWTEYAHGAQQSYRKHGVEGALDVDALCTGADTVMPRVHCGRPTTSTRLLNGRDSPANRPSAP